MPVCFQKKKKRGIDNSSSKYRKTRKVTGMGAVFSYNYSSLFKYDDRDEMRLVTSILCNLLINPVLCCGSIVDSLRKYIIFQCHLSDKLIAAVCNWEVKLAL